MKRTLRDIIVAVGLTAFTLSGCGNYSKYQEAVQENVVNLQNVDEYQKRELGELFDLIADSEGTWLYSLNDKNQQLLKEKRNEFIEIDNYFEFIRDYLINYSLGASNEDAQEIFAQAEDVGFILNPSGDFCYLSMKDLRSNVKYSAESGFYQYKELLTLERQVADYCKVSDQKQIEIEEEVLKTIIEERVIDSIIWNKSEEGIKADIKSGEEHYLWTYETSEVLGIKKPNFLGILVVGLYVKAFQEIDKCHFERDGFAGAEDYLNTLEVVSRIYGLDNDQMINQLEKKIEQKRLNNCLN